MKSTAAALGLALLCAGCGPATPAPDADWPAGALLSARTETLRSVLEGLAQQETTPLGQTARAWLASLPACPEVEAEAHGGGFSSLPAALRCATPDASDAPFRRWRGDADVALALPLGEGPRLRLRAHERDDGLALAVAWPDAPATGWLGSLLPGDAPAGPSVLAAAGTVLHARARASGPLDLAAFADEGSQGDQLFRLRSELFGKAVLDGHWELALYPPAKGRAMPGAVLALGVTLESLAERALDGFIGELETTWTLSRTPTAFGDAMGACLLELTVLPEFAPCAVTTRDSVLVGWNAASLRTALAEHGAEAGGPTPGRATLDFDRLRDTDEHLASRHAEADAVAPVPWPWQRLQLDARRETNTLAVEIELLEARDPTS